MWKRLPRWIWIGAWLLALVAGMVNVVGILGFEHETLTHMTGLTSRFAQGVVERDWHDVSIVLSIMASFVGGAMLSGLLVQDIALQWGRRYGLALFLESVLLAVATVLVKRHFAAGFCMASFACGLQNALATNFSGATLRTTHVSGMYTDLGMSIGHWLRRRPVDVVRVRICISTISGFAAGGAISAAMFPRIGLNALYIPAGIALALSVAYHLLRRRNGEGQSKQLADVAVDPDSLIAASHVVAVEFATIAAANNYWR
jgi:uncharacterized membrane protein YoaK (UPF0700 family)